MLKIQVTITHLHAFEVHPIYTRLPLLQLLSWLVCMLDTLHDIGLLRDVALVDCGAIIMWRVDAFRVYHDCWIVIDLSPKQAVLQSWAWIREY